MTDREIFRAEIVRRMQEYESWPDYQYDSNYKELVELLAFVDSMKEVSVSKDLVSAAKEDAKFKRSDDTEVGYDLNRASGFIAGAQWYKQKMIGEAIERDVKIDTGGYPYIDVCLELYDYDNDVPLAKKGDKVKLIIVTE